MFDDRIILHMHPLTRAITCYSLCFDTDVQYFFRRCIVAPPVVHQWKRGKSENPTNGRERVQKKQALVKQLLYYKEI